jgi:peptidoglycan L-alanyl-D-glutamate endopeptidase CwlK
MPILPVLRRGARGAEVKLLQERLATAGFRPGDLDGRFGPATEAALLAFQQASDLLPDGVAGPVTWQALAQRGSGLPADRSAEITPDFVADMFPFTPLGTIRRYLPAVLAGLRRHGLVDKPMLLMALATIRAETESFTPIAEHVSRFNTSPDGHPFDLYDHRRDLGNQGPPDGARFRGRGFVQLTGRANYRHYGEQLDLPLAREPDRALEPATAGRLLAAFLAERARPIKLALIEGDLTGARRLVNGGRHGLARFVEAWRIGDRLLEDRVWPSVRAA